MREFPNVLKPSRPSSSAMSKRLSFSESAKAESSPAREMVACLFASFSLATAVASEDTAVACADCAAAA